MRFFFSAERLGLKSTGSFSGNAELLSKAIVECEFFPLRVITFHCPLCMGLMHELEKRLSSARYQVFLMAMCNCIYLLLRFQSWWHSKQTTSVPLWESPEGDPAQSNGGGRHTSQVSSLL